MCCSPEIIRVIKPGMMRWVGQVACMGEVRNAHKIVIRKPEGRRPFGKK
jgi:hypothetical protein